MIAHILVYAFLAIALGAMLYVVGMPWKSPKAREISHERHHPINRNRIPR
jgi:hypothetical protein